MDWKENPYEYNLQVYQNILSQPLGSYDYSCWTWLKNHSEINPQRLQPWTSPGIPGQPVAASPNSTYLDLRNMNTLQNNLNLLCLFVEEAVVPNSIWRSFVNVFYLICVLMGATTLVKELFVLGVVMRVVFTVSHVGPIVPSRYLPRSWHVNSEKVKKMG